MTQLLAHLEIAAGVVLVGAACFMAGWKMRGQLQDDRFGSPSAPSYLMPVKDRGRRRRPKSEARARW